MGTCLVDRDGDWWSLDYEMWTLHKKDSFSRGGSLKVDGEECPTVYGIDAGGYLPFDPADASSIVRFLTEDWA